MAKEMNFLNIGNNKFEVADALARGQIHNFIEDHDQDAVETLVWDGSMSHSGDFDVLKELLTDYDRIKLQFDGGRIFYADPTQAFWSFALSDANTSSGLTVETWELLLTDRDASASVPEGSTRIDLVITQLVWDGDAAENAVITPNADSSIGHLLKIIGIKNVTNAELQDIRVGVDGTVYPTAGDAVREQMEQAMSSGSGLTADVKEALLDCFNHVAWTDEHGQDYVDALEAALYPPVNLAYISAVYTQSGTVYDTDSLDSLKDDLVVTAHYDDGTSEVVTTYTLSGTLAGGTSTITVTYGGKTTTFTVNVYQPAELLSISAVYTQSGTVYDTDTLDSLKVDLVVTATYDDSSTATITDYTLSGTLTEGTSTITVSYGGKTTTFTVTVSSGRRLPTGYTGASYIQSSGDAYIDTGIKEVPDGVTKFWGNFAANVASTNTKSLFGYQGIASGQVSTYRLLLLLTANNELAYYGATSGLSAAISGWDASAVNDVTVSLTDNTTYPVFIVNDVTTTGNKQKTTTSNSGVGTIYLLAQNYKAGGADAGDKAVDGSYIRCYGFKIFGANDALLRDYFPCVRTADSIAGLYDFVTETFYPSIGENAFTSGV